VVAPEVFILIPIFLEKFTGVLKAIGLSCSLLREGIGYEVYVNLKSDIIKLIP
jgi:hypothetical protein